MADDDVEPGLPGRRIPIPPGWTTADAEEFFALADAARERWLAERKRHEAETRKRWWYELKAGRQRELLVHAELAPKPPKPPAPQEPRAVGRPRKPDGPELDDDDAVRIAKLRAKNGKLSAREIARRLEISGYKVSEYKVRRFLDRHKL